MGLALMPRGAGVDVGDRGHGGRLDRKERRDQQVVPRVGSEQVRDEAESVVLLVDRRQPVEVGVAVGAEAGEGVVPGVGLDDAVWRTELAES
jgi:hypothetical protein